MSSGCEQRLNLLCIVFPLCGSRVSTPAKYFGGGGSGVVYQCPKPILRTQTNNKKKMPRCGPWLCQHLVVDVFPVT